MGLLDGLLGQVLSGALKPGRTTAAACRTWVARAGREWAGSSRSWADSRAAARCRTGQGGLESILGGLAGGAGPARDRQWAPAAAQIAMLQLLQQNGGLGGLLSQVPAGRLRRAGRLVGVDGREHPDLRPTRCRRCWARARSARSRSSSACRTARPPSRLASVLPQTRRPDDAEGSGAGRQRRRRGAGARDPATRRTLTARRTSGALPRGAVRRRVRATIAARRCARALVLPPPSWNRPRSSPRCCSASSRA